MITIVGSEKEKTSNQNLLHFFSSHPHLSPFIHYLIPLDAVLPYRANVVSTKIVRFNAWVSILIRARKLIMSLVKTKMRDPLRMIVKNQ